MWNKIHPLWITVGIVVIGVIVIFIIFGADDPGDSPSRLRQWWDTALPDITIGDILIVLLIHAWFSRK